MNEYITLKRRYELKIDYIIYIIKCIYQKKRQMFGWREKNRSDFMLGNQGFQKKNIMSKSRLF